MYNKKIHWIFEISLNYTFFSTNKKLILKAFLDTFFEHFFLLFKFSVNKSIKPLLNY